MSLPPKQLPECWGHRGASAAYPENTLASFEKAIRDGAEGFESDVHLSLDDVVIMFHDPSLDRTTNGKGLIREKNWYGPDGMEHLLTTKEPKQSIPTFAETVALLMKPENRHAKLNVDIKVHNDPVRLFTLMHKVISAHPDWEAELAPRILLGVWHTKFIPHARSLLPYCRLLHLGWNIGVARKYFWDSCDGFSMNFALMASLAGQKFREDCKAAGKSLIVWTLNNSSEMVEAASWEVDALLSDVPNVWFEMRASLEVDREKVMDQHDRYFLWRDWRYYMPSVLFWALFAHFYLQYMVEPLKNYPPMRPAATIAVST